MTPVDVLVELGLIAVLMVVWVGLVMLMLERDRKRFERRTRYCVTETTETSSLGGGNAPALPSTKEPRLLSAAQEDNREIQPE